MAFSVGGDGGRRSPEPLEHFAGEPATLMMAVRPHAGQRHLNDNWPAIAEHSQLVLK